MPTYILKESDLFSLITNMVVETINEIQYGDNKRLSTSVKTGGYGRKYQYRGNKGAMDAPRGDKPEYYAGLPTPSEIELYSPNKMAFFKAKNFRENADKI